MSGKGQVQGRCAVASAVGHRWIFISGVLLAGVLTGSLGGPSSGAVAKPKSPEDEAAGREAFLAAYKVFMHPRCMNCHPAGDAPLQGDDSHVHLQLVQRGIDGEGKYALKCANCHQPTDVPGANMPPGTPDWHLPKADTPLVFQG